MIGIQFLIIGFKWINNLANQWFNIIKYIQILVTTNYYTNDLETKLTMQTLQRFICIGALLQA